MNYAFEICANSAESCVAAQEGGANRVELCAAIPEGGTTPSYGEIRMARKLIDIRFACDYSSAWRRFPFIHRLRLKPWKKIFAWLVRQELTEWCLVV